MPTLRDLNTMARRAPQGRPLSPWRDKLLPAHFDGRQFHVESGAMESGRRIVVHEFPKKERPYAEDMGQRAVEFTVRGYLICYPHDDPSGPDLWRRDYTIARDVLQQRLDRGGPGTLQLPTFKNQIMTVVCTRYRMQEESRFGGYCVFDMTFVERGVRPFETKLDTAENLIAQSQVLQQETNNWWARQRAAQQQNVPARSRG